MTLQVDFLPIAREEFDEAADRYEKIRAGLGVDFIEDISRCIDRAIEGPARYAKVLGEIRHVRSHRFPYAVYFRAEAERIVVMAVFHGSREPKRWQQRG
jgi:plasmid stabilization system protein ParE